MTVGIVGSGVGKLVGIGVGLAVVGVIVGSNVGSRLTVGGGVGSIKNSATSPLAIIC